MAESKSNLAVFDGVTWIPSRPEVLPLVTDILISFWGVAVTFLGGESELVSAGIASAEMFLGIGKSGQRSRYDEFGNQYTIKRRARGRWEIHLRLDAEATTALPSDEWPKCKEWWLRNGSEAIAATDAILARFSRRLK